MLAWQAKAWSCTRSSHCHFCVPGHFAYVPSFCIACELLERTMHGPLCILHNWLHMNQLWIHSDNTRAVRSLMELRWRDTSKCIRVYVKKKIWGIKPVMLLLLLILKAHRVHLPILPLTFLPASFGVQSIPHSHWRMLVPVGRWKVMKTGKKVLHFLQSCLL